MNPAKSSFMLRINAFARDIATYVVTKPILSKDERESVELELKAEFTYLLRQDPETIKAMERHAEFGV